MHILRFTIPLISRIYLKIYCFSGQKADRSPTGSRLRLGTWRTIDGNKQQDTTVTNNSACCQKTQNPKWRWTGKKRATFPHRIYN